MREDPGLFKPVRLMGEPTREFTPTMDYRHLLSAEALASLLERDAKMAVEDAKAIRDAEIEATHGPAVKAATAAREKRAKVVKA